MSDRSELKLPSESAQQLTEEGINRFVESIRHELLRAKKDGKSVFAQVQRGEREIWPEAGYRRFEPDGSVDVMIRIPENAWHGTDG